MQQVSDIGENKLIEELTQDLSLSSNILVGPGDDCAVLEGSEGIHTLLKTDTIVEGVHYLAEEDPHLVGWKAVARVVSDFAAMAGKPEALVVALAFKPDTPVSYLKELYRGMQSSAEKYHFSIVGGETSSSSCNIITVSGTGKCGQYITRSNAKLGDILYVTGTLGGSIKGKHLSFTPRVDEAQWLAQHMQPSAMMDLSDGIAKDLTRLAKLSEVGYSVDFTSLPCSPGCTIQQALSDGEDYELLFTSPVALDDDLLEKWNTQFPDTQLTAIGKITKEVETDLTGGWEHFQ